MSHVETIRELIHQSWNRPQLVDEIEREGQTLKRVLFVCSQNRLRSPTAEQVFSTWPGIEVASAGLNNDAETPLTKEAVAWADLIFVMERTHRTKLQNRFRKAIRGRIICLDIPDEYEFMDPALVSRLNHVVPRFLP